jgi:hypothetical protein
MVGPAWQNGHSICTEVRSEKFFPPSIISRFGGFRMTAQQTTKEWGRIVARAWADDQFKDRLLAEPAAVMREHGLEVPTGTQVKVVEDAALATDTDICHFVLPARPAVELQEEEFAGSVAAGVWGGCGRCFCGFCGGCIRCGRCRCGRCGCF